MRKIDKFITSGETNLPDHDNHLVAMIDRQKAKLEKLASSPMVKTQNEFSGFVKEQILKDVEETGLEPGDIVKMIVHQHYRKKAA